MLKVYELAIKMRRSTSFFSFGLLHKSIEKVFIFREHPGWIAQKKKQNKNSFKFEISSLVLKQATQRLIQFLILVLIVYLKGGEFYYKSITTLISETMRQCGAREGEMKIRYHREEIYFFLETPTVLPRRPVVLVC